MLFELLSTRSLIVNLIIRIVFGVASAPLYTHFQHPAGEVLAAIVSIKMLKLTLILMKKDCAWRSLRCYCVPILLHQVEV